MKYKDPFSSDEARYIIDQITIANKAILNINRALKQYPKDKGLIYLKKVYKDKIETYTEDLKREVFKE